MTTSTIAQAVADSLKQWGIVYNVALVGPTTRDKWECDQWRVTLEKDGKVETFDYYTGKGLRAPATAQQKEMVRRGFPGLTDNDLKGKTGYGKRYLAAVESLRSPVAPDAAGVIYSLTLDASATEQSFSDWCTEYGYDDDSMKAFRLYTDCCNTGKQLHRLFSEWQLNVLRELLQDY